MYFGNKIVSIRSIKVKIQRLTHELNRESLRNNPVPTRALASSAFNQALGQAGALS